MDGCYNYSFRGGKGKMIIYRLGELQDMGVKITVNK
jgi:hypothetical protein